MRNRKAPQEKAGLTRAEPITTTAVSDTTTIVGFNTAAAQRKAARKRGLQKVRRWEQGKDPFLAGWTYPCHRVHAHRSLSAQLVGANRPASV